MTQFLSIALFAAISAGGIWMILRTLRSNSTAIRRALAGRSLTATALQSGWTARGYDVMAAAPRKGPRTDFWRRATKLRAAA